MNARACMVALGVVAAVALSGCSLMGRRYSEHPVTVREIVLLADDAGAGKTIMTGLYVREMINRGRLRRVIICCPAGLTWKSLVLTLWARHRLKLPAGTLEQAIGRADTNPIEMPRRTPVKTSTWSVSIFCLPPRP